MLLTVEIPRGRYIKVLFVLLLSQGANIQGVHIQHDAPSSGDIFSFKPRDDILEGDSIGQVNKFVDVDLKCPSFIGKHVMHDGAP